MRNYAQKISDAKYREGPEVERSSKVFMRRMVPAAEPLYVLDVGCGTGLNAGELAALGHKVAGVDISEEAVARFKLAGFEGWRCDIAAGLPLEDGRFDLIYASEVIEHVVDTPAFLSELYRVLRPGGMLLLSTPNSAFWVFRLLGLFGRTLSEVQHPGHVRFYSRSGLLEYLREAGFVDAKCSARHMYLVLGDRLGSPLRGLLSALGFQREFRFKTKTYFWQWSRFSQRASAVWADTLIVQALKPSVKVEG